jgi:hypothetical protein
MRKRDGKENCMYMNAVSYKDMFAPPSSLGSSDLTSKKTAPSLIRVEKKFLRNWVQRVSKEAKFCTDFKNV